MPKYLVIVESYSKAPIIQRYLGKDYKVMSSGGHIRDLAKKDGRKQTKAKQKPAQLTEKQKLAHKLSVDPYNNWKAHYAIIADKKKQLNELKKHAADKSIIFLATDLDREGEAIAWHLKESLGSVSAQFKRVVFSEITPLAIRKAFEHPRDLNMDRVRAQQTRRYLDRVVGFMLSPLLWQKVARGLSAGRVQSVAVRLIVEREHEIKSFVPEEYWQLSATFKDYHIPDQPGYFKAKVTHIHNDTQKTAYRPTTEAESQTHVQALLGQHCTLTSVEHKNKTLRPSPPFTTSTLQQAASIRLGFGVKRTMVIAQKLYEAGLITYMRTDSTHVSEHAQQQASEFISTHYGKDYLPSTPPTYTSKGKTQEAHEAIRPSKVSKNPDGLKGVIPEEQSKIYNLIWRRFVASQMTNACQTMTTFVLNHTHYSLKISGKKLIFDGYQKVLPPSSQDDLSLPDLNQGDILKIHELFPSQHFTKPPPRYSEARFVAELEKRGIGRPSTYVPIISTIQDRGYVSLKNRKFHALKMGELVSEKLTANFTKIMNYNFTAKMEEDLDEIASGELSWQKTLDKFFSDFTQTLENATQNMRPAVATPIDYPCECGEKMAIKTGRTGVFLICSVNCTLKSEDKKSRKYTKSLQPAEEILAHKSSINEEEWAAQQLAHQKRCPLCDTAMVSYVIDAKNMVHVCGKNPTCPGYVMETGSFKMPSSEAPTYPCDRCEPGRLELKIGRFGKYYACNRCPNTRKVLKNGEMAPPKADPIPMPELSCEKSKGYFVLRDGAAGLFLASSEFPRSRETKKPKVKDLKRHRHQLESKFYFLADAPPEDPNGQDFEIRFARKTKSYFLSSESLSSSGRSKQKTQKPSWVATYNGSSWKLKQDRPASKTSRSKIQKT